MMSGRLPPGSLGRHLGPVIVPTAELVDHVDFGMPFLEQLDDAIVRSWRSCDPHQAIRKFGLLTVATGVRGGFAWNRCGLRPESAGAGAVQPTPEHAYRQQRQHQ